MAPNQPYQNFLLNPIKIKINKINKKTIYNTQAIYITESSETTIYINTSTSIFFFLRRKRRRNKRQNKWRRRVVELE